MQRTQSRSRRSLVSRTIFLLTFLLICEGIGATNHRFEVNSDGTVTDKRSDAVWLRDADCFGALSLAEAQQQVRLLEDGVCGLTDGSKAGDWFLPSIAQLESLLDAEPSNHRFEAPNISNAAGDGPWTEGDAFFGIRSRTPGPPDLYWSISRAGCPPTGVRTLSPFQGFSLGCLPADAEPAGVWPIRNPAEFQVVLTTKMFIAPIPRGHCDPARVVGDNPIRQDLFNVYCSFTSLWFGSRDDADTAELTSPLDARIRSAARLSWSCSAESPHPTNARFVSLGSQGGPEPFLPSGSAEEPRIRESLTDDGRWALVAAGAPHPAAEPAFGFHRERSHRLIWHKLEGTIRCEPGSDGGFRSNVDLDFSAASAFPSHRAWLELELGSLETSSPTALAQQGLFSNLWFLEPVPSP